MQIWANINDACRLATCNKTEREGEREREKNPKVSKCRLKIEGDNLFLITGFIYVIIQHSKSKLKITSNFQKRLWIHLIRNHYIRLQFKRFKVQKQCQWNMISKKEYNSDFKGGRVQSNNQIKTSLSLIPQNIHDTSNRSNLSYSTKARIKWKFVKNTRIPNRSGAYHGESPRFRSYGFFCCRFHQFNYDVNRHRKKYVRMATCEMDRHVLDIDSGVCYSVSVQNVD